MAPEDPDSAALPAALKRRVALGARLRALRTTAGLLQADVAAGVGMDRGYYGQIESGGRNVTVDKVFALADVLGVHPAELFSGPEFARQAEGDDGQPAAPATDA